MNHLGDAKRVGIERLWDIANTIRLGVLQAAPLYGLGTDDSHNYFGDRGSSPGRGWVMVHCDQLSPDALIEAMKRGEFYASSGVTLKSVQYAQSSKQLRIEIDPRAWRAVHDQFRRHDPARVGEATLAGDSFNRDADWIARWSRA